MAKQHISLRIPLGKVDYTSFKVAIRSGSVPDLRGSSIPAPFHDWNVIPGVANQSLKRRFPSLLPIFYTIRLSGQIHPQSQLFALKHQL
jgi:hypothetical protein